MNRKINKDWHSKNRMPAKAKPAQKLQWHVNHARECGCRPIPGPIKLLMKERKPKLIVAVLVQNKNKYLLVREPLESGGEKWIIPGGKVEFGESLEAAAAREIEEETAIKPKKLEFLKFYEANFAQYNYHTVIFFYLAKTAQTKLGKDIEGKVQEARWFTLAEIKKLAIVESAEWLFAWLNSDDGKHR